MLTCVSRAHARSLFLSTQIGTMTGEVVSYSGPGPGPADAINCQQQEVDLGKDGRAVSPAKRFPFQAFVDWHAIDGPAESLANSPARTSLGRRSLVGAGSLLGARRKALGRHAKSADEVERIAETGKLRELKHCLRVHSWPPADPVRSRLWQVTSLRNAFIKLSTISLLFRSCAAFTAKTGPSETRSTGTR